ncbi:hypothetical protein DOTSEDRAFT_62969 [Dothistroma septosporum NZE10]|uniref:aldehyde dehydrogenase (NAD(+)) n=1 Tax=Dothistroma septosporum (strain NZE10 / CBS 128990) TaxID=675120 RepID=N1PNT9_DOTSN|nr:hypothetical protein DOTSEDRAFT_62969 [Dothistroma septosporum NZE10]
MTLSCSQLTFPSCHAASDNEVAITIKAAQDVFESGIWSRADRHYRADTLENIAAHLSRALPALIALEAQVPSLTKWFKYYAALIRTEERPVLPTTGKLHNWIDRKPLGVVIQITPFNHPLLIAVKKIAPALAAGNSVILKPSELTPLTSLMLGKIMKEAGLPDGVLSVLPGYGATTGKALVSHPLVKKVDVTGGTPAGRAIGAIAGANLAKYTAELGGKAPVIMTENANLPLAVNGVAFGAFMASGQTCIAATRIVVHESISAAFVSKLKAKAESIEQRIGSPTNRESVEVVSGARRLTGSSPLDGFDLSRGHFYPPTLLTDGPSTKIVSTRIWREEAFGPVIVIVSYTTESEALHLANDSEFGLGAAVWTNDLSQAHRLSDGIEAGICWVNSHHRNDPSSPWGGVGRSGVGSENGVDAYHAYTTTNSTIINYASNEEALGSDDWFREGGGRVRYG